MNKIMNKITMVLAIGLSLSGMTACSGPDDIITNVEFNRLFSPTQLEAKVQNTTGVKLSWFAISPAENIDIEIYADDADMSFAGTPVYKNTIKPASGDISSARTECSWILPAGTLEGETTYSVRIKAIGNDMESKWSGTTFETGTEQVFNDVPATDITKTSVTLTWPANIAATHVTVQKSGEVLLTHNLTREEIEAGSVTIDGLNVESTYTFFIYNGEKQRGKIQVQTLPNYTPVTDATELMKAIEDAEAGEVIMLTSNAVYDFTDAAAMGKEEAVKSIKIEKDIILNTNNNATIKGIYFQIFGGANFEFANITLDGEGGSGDQAFNYKEDGNYGKLYIHDAEIKNYKKGLTYINVKALVDDITINNCYIHDITCDGGDFIDSRQGGWNTLTLKNSTVYNSNTKNRAIIRFDQNTNVTATAITNIENCTFAKTGIGAGNSYGFLHLRYTGNSSNFKNNVVADFDQQRGFSDQTTTTQTVFSNNFYYNTKNLLSKDATSEKNPAFFDNEGTEISADPFKDAAKGDLTIIDEKIKDKEAGDPRWLK